MRTNLGLFAVFSLILLMIIPVHADVTSVTIDKESFSIEDNFTISGTNDDEGGVMLVASMKGPKDESLNRNAYSSGGTFTFTPVNADDLFDREGTYTFTIFTEYQQPINGTVIKMEYNNGIVSMSPDFELNLKSIGNKQIDETEKLSFTASITESQIKDKEFSLDKHPSGAIINKDTGVFSWTPTTTQAGGYIFDIIVKAGTLEDRETITVTVTDKPITTPPTQTEPEPEPEDLGIASFVDETKDPQSYVDRYNNEASYKKWFDDNFAEYDSIYQAVGLEEPKVLAPFVDPNLDPQYYVDRYNKETTYKEWFDETYPDITIYDAVGLEEPEVIEQEYGECGEGTDLVDGMCIIVDNSEGGGCLIATATYGSEMAPQVQFLREIRDNQLMSTESGVSFMTGFNQFYYSFSPHVADMERESPIFKEMVKIGITPLLSTLSVMSFAETESEVFGYGIGVILMNLGMYVAAPAIIIFKTRKYIKI